MKKCFYCGKRKRANGSMFYKLDQDGNEICQSCMRDGHWKSALEIIEHNKKADTINKKGQHLLTGADRWR